MFGDNPNDQQLKAGWDAFCDQLKDASELVFLDSNPSHDIDRAKGFRLLARNISLALQFHLENNNPEVPELLHYFDPIRKQGGDNTDALYVGAPVDGNRRYRIHGQRGTAKYFAVTVLEDGNTPWGGAVVGSLIDQNISVNDDGSFELFLGPEPECASAAGSDAVNYIQTTPGSWRITFRQFFADWENETPMVASIECLDGDSAPGLLTPLHVQQGLQDAAAWVRESTFYWAGMLDRWRVRPNDFVSYRQLDDNAIDATPGGEPLICYWKLPEDEALIVKVTPPKASYWAVEFGNCWWESMDYRYHLCSTNCHHAQLQDDGELVIVVSHIDTGIANWLDPSGHEEGYMALRWINAESYPRPDCQQVKLSELNAALRDDVKRISKEQRREQLAGRRRGVQRRFPH